jgi:TetR/AcrR family transcriptional regulator
MAAARSRRTDILHAARREFATAGFSGARIERIAASADVNKQLLFHYFDSKEGLFTAALAALLAELETAPPPSAQATPVAQLKGLLRELVTTVRSVPGFVGILADATSNPGFPPPARELVAAWKARMLARLAAALRDGQRRGYFRDDVDPGSVAAVALAAAVGVVAVDGALPFEEVLPGLLVEHCAWR